MERATPPAGRDPYFDRAQPAPVKGSIPPPYDPERRRRQFRSRSRLLIVALVAVWLWVLFDPIIGPMVLGLLGLIAGTLGVLGAAMGLALLGFGLCTTGDRFLGWLRRNSTWPEK